MLLRDQNLLTNRNTGQIDTYGRVRSSNIYTLFESECTFDDEPLFWYNVAPVGTSVTYNNSRSSNILRVNASTSATVTRQSKMFFKYSSGKSQLYGWTAVMKTSASGTTGVISRVGGFSDTDGVFFEYNNGVMNVVRRSSTSGSPVDLKIPQSQWNRDKGDGTGVSGVNIDWTKMHIFEIAFQWQGGGVIRYQVRFDGQLIILHELSASNQLDVIWCNNPNFPARAQVICDGNNDIGELEIACFCVQQEANGNQSAHVHQSIARTLSLTTGADTNAYVVCAIRLRTDHLGARVKLLSGQLFSVTTNANYYYAIVRDPIITSGSYTWVSKTNSAVEFHNTGNGPQVTLFSGLVEFSGYNSQSRGAGSPGGLLLSDQNILALGYNDPSTPEVLALVVRNLDSASKEYYGAMNWIEQ